MQKDIGKNIRKVKELMSIRQEYVANKLSISQSSYSDLESGKSSITDEKLDEIAKALGVTKGIIENFTEQAIFNFCTQSGYINTNNINSFEKIDELYKEVISSLKQQLALQEKMIHQLTKENEQLRNEKS